MIYVFKTNINSENQIRELTPYINKLFPDSAWNFDLEDCDKIFRIESKENILDAIISLFKALNFQCEELK